MSTIKQNLNKVRCGKLKFKLGELVKYNGEIMRVCDGHWEGFYPTPFYNLTSAEKFVWNAPENQIQKLPTVYSIKHPGNDKAYNFKSNLELKNGDKVLCDTVFGPETGIVVGINSDYPATKWIISKLDTTEYDKAIEEENREREKEDIRTHIQDLEKKLAAEKEKLNQL